MSKSITVIAPADLDEGYTFDVSVEGKAIPVVVPPGGVTYGQRFQALSPRSDLDEHAPLLSGSGGNSAVKGKWRYGLFDCCGACCGAFCMGCCFPGILAGQVFQRNKLSIWGSPAENSDYKNTCAIMTYIAVAVILITGTLNNIAFGNSAQEDEIVSEEEEMVTPTTAIASSLVWNLYSLYLIVALTYARIEFRKRYQIPGGCCGKCHDFCTVAWCMCCSVLQMHNHTNDEYATCSATGSKPKQPLIRAEIV